VIAVCSSAASTLSKPPSKAVTMNLLGFTGMISSIFLLKTTGRYAAAFSSKSSFVRSPTHQFTKRAYSRSTMTMKLQTAIVGLPNVGKSTLFNALTESQGAEMGNYPFCTIESNVGIVTVPDPKLQKLTELNSSEKTVPTTLEFVDVAGLIKGASQGEGLGNKFLASIRQCDAIVHVVRCFEDDDVIHVDGTVNPIRDAELINLELTFADLAQVEQRLLRIKKDRNADPQEKSALEKVQQILESNKPARYAELEKDEEAAIKSLGLLTRKPIIYAANVADTDLAEGNEMVDKLRKLADEEGAKLVIVSAQVEAELVDLEPEDREEFLESLGVTLDNCGLRALIREAYDLLQLQTYYTSGPKETRAWTIRKGWTAPKAAGVIHTDFERGFIRAETISYEDLIECGSEVNAKSKGLLRSEGKDYVVQEGDVILFRFNV
jgi:GTP-binding protein YchF